MSRESFYYKTKHAYATQKIPSLLEPFPALSPMIAQMNNWNTTPVEKELQPTTMTVRYKMLPNANPGDPAVWGPAFWFSMHNGAERYPIKAAPLWAKRMKHFILGIPVMVPCENCADHATAYIESRNDLNEVVKSREKTN